MKIETNPGRFSSENNKWYFSCAERSSVLVGMKGSDTDQSDPVRPREYDWTCPIVGLDRYPVSDDQIALLNCDGEMIVGNDTGIGIWRISKKRWNEITGIQIDLEEWGNETNNVAFLTTDTEEVVRLHFAFE